MGDVTNSTGKPTEQGYIKLDEDLFMRDSPSNNVPLTNAYMQALQSLFQRENRASLFPTPSSSSASKAESSSSNRNENRNSREDTEKELRLLLKTIENDYNINLEDRTGTPDALIPTLMEHQKKGLSWLISMEEGPKKGGLLADDMGLGKVRITYFLDSFSTMLFEVSRSSIDNTNDCIDTSATLLRCRYRSHSSCAQLYAIRKGEDTTNVYKNL